MQYCVSSENFEGIFTARGYGERKANEAGAVDFSLGPVAYCVSRQLAQRRNGEPRDSLRPLQV